MYLTGRAGKNASKNFHVIFLLEDGNRNRLIKLVRFVLNVWLLPHENWA
jgi:hypothetical protein